MPHTFKVDDDTKQVLGNEASAERDSRSAFNAHPAAAPRHGSCGGTRRGGAACRGSCAAADRTRNGRTGLAPPHHDPERSTEGNAARDRERHLEVLRERPRPGDPPATRQPRPGGDEGHLHLCREHRRVPSVGRRCQRPEDHQPTRGALAHFVHAHHRRHDAARPWLPAPVVRHRHSQSDPQPWRCLLRHSNRAVAGQLLFPLRGGQRMVRLRPARDALGLPRACQDGERSHRSDGLLDLL